MRNIAVRTYSKKIINDYLGAIPKLESATWPGLPADILSILLITATQCDGTILLHEKLFESRLFFVDRLRGMGARIVLCDPHRAVVIGPEQLKGAEMSSPDIRAGMALVSAALCADGQSEVHNVTMIDRGYEQFERKLRMLGAKISRVER